MRFVTSSGIELFVPAIFPSKDALNAWPYFWALYFLELLSIVVVVPGTVLLLISLSNSVRFFHKNLIQVAQVSLGISAYSANFLFFLEKNFT